MNLRNVKDYHNRYGKSLQEYGFTRQGNAYWRVYGDSIFQAICFRKIKWRCRIPEGSVEILASLFSLAKPESCILRLHDNIQDMDEEAWEISSNINLQWCCENVLGMCRENLGKEAWTDLMLKECIQIFQKSDTAEGAYESLKILNQIEKSNRWNLPSPEIRTEEMYWLAILAQKYDACRAYIDFNRQLNLLGIKESIQRDDPSEKSRLEEMPGVIGQWKRERKRLHFIEEHPKEFQEECAKNIEKQWCYLKNEDRSQEGIRIPESYISDLSHEKICKAGFREQKTFFWRFYGEKEIQVIQFSGYYWKINCLRIGTYPFYCNSFLKNLMREGAEVVLDNFGMWDVEAKYESMYGKAKLAEQLVDYALQTLDRADTAEHAYEIWTEFLNAKEYTKTYDVSSGMNWPECVASPMAYYMIQVGKYEKVRDFLKLWEDDEEYEWENYFQEECNRISEIYERALNGDTEFAKQCLEKNYRENREAYGKILKTDF